MLYYKMNFFDFILNYKYILIYIFMKNWNYLIIRINIMNNFF